MQNSQFEKEIKRQNERLKWIIKGLDFNDLNEWEAARLEEWEIQSNNGKWLSDRQMEIVERIYKEKGK